MRRRLADELELKAVVPDPDVLRARLTRPAAAARFRGRMSDRRYDRAGELAARDEVLRVRSYRSSDGRTRDDPRLEGPDPALGRRVQAARGDTRSPCAADPARRCSPRWATAWSTQSIGTSRSTTSSGAAVRLELYPDMDRCSRSRARPDAIERAIRATGIARDAFTAESLADFVRRFEARTGRPAVLARP